MSTKDLLSTYYVPGAENMTKNKKKTKTKKLSVLMELPFKLLKRNLKQTNKTYTVSGKCWGK